VSRLDARIGRLEAQLGDCPACKERPVAVSLHGPDSTPATEPVESCGFCGQPIRQLHVLLAFDPGAGAPPQ
jgi:hypothetical protein